MSDPHPLDCDSAQRPAGPLTPEQISVGHAHRRRRGRVPADLPPPDRDRLAGEARVLLRERLLDLIARAVARDLLRAAAARTRRSHHDPAPLSLDKPYAVVLYAE